MELADFINNIRESGEIIVDNGSVDLSNSGNELAKELKLTYDLLSDHFSGKVPPFSELGAIWGARTLYRIVQYLLIREANEEEIRNDLFIFEDELTSEVIFSVDLTLRHLPNIYHLAKDLSPDDILVKKIEEISTQFPLSSVGIEIKETLDVELILRIPSLRIEYVDRIIERKAKDRLSNKDVCKYIEAVLDKNNSIWPNYKNLILTLNDE